VQFYRRLWVWAAYRKSVLVSHKLGCHAHGVTVALNEWSCCGIVVHFLNRCKFCHFRVTVRVSGVSYRVVLRIRVNIRVEI